MTPALQQALLQLRLEHPLRLTPAQASALGRSTGLSENKLAQALLAQAQRLARAPVSGFAVGAIAITGSGHWYLGANLEFTGLALHHAVHAEQSAIGHAALYNERRIVKMVVSASPCGHCRQFMQELNQPELLIILPGEQHTLAALLPHAFGPADLGISTGMLGAAPAPLASDSPDPVQQAALTEANHSHAPYSHNQAGVALKLTDGRVITGRYLENAAFNPGLGPMQLALSQLSLHRAHPEHICQAVLAERTTTTSQYPGAAQLLAAVSSVPLHHLALSSRSAS